MVSNTIITITVVYIMINVICINVIHVVYVIIDHNVSLYVILCKIKYSRFSSTFYIQILPSISRIGIQRIANILRSPSTVAQML